MATRRLRVFKRWMKSHGVEWSDTLEFTDSSEEGIAVRALCELKEGDVVAKIPKEACLTIKTSGAREMIEDARLDGSLGLAVAVMYERSLGEESNWAGYLQLLPDQECLPLVWTLDEVNDLLCGTELHKTVQEDKTLVYEDWKENILPLLDFAPSTLNPKYFGIEQYFAARSLVASRSFRIDEYHGFGMVPLADLFNHKTGAEHVHFTYYGESNDNDDDNDDVVDNNDNNECVNNEEQMAQNSCIDKTVDLHFSSLGEFDDDNGNDNNECVSNEEQVAQSSSIDKTELNTAVIGKSSNRDLECSSDTGDDPSMLEMIMVKDVSTGTEVFNTYGLMGNAALLHRYGFTEQDNPYDIVNIDMELVLQWCSSLFSGRYCRARVSLWRRLGYSACVSQNSEYFEISFDGEPQIELLVLLYIMLLTEDAYHKMDLAVTVGGSSHESSEMTLLDKNNIFTEKESNTSKRSLLTKIVCDALISIADMRETLYGLNSIEDDIEALERCNCVRERKLYHSLMLRISERKILEKLRTYAAQSYEFTKQNSVRKRLKRTTKKYS